MTRSSPVFLLPLLAACGDAPADDSGEGACSGAPSLVMGGGEAEWEPMNDGDVVTMIHGPQDGWHVLVSLNAENVSQIVTIDIEVTSPEHDGAVVAGVSGRKAMVPDGDCAWTYPGLYAIFDVADIAEGNDDEPWELLGYEPLVITATITDTEGRTATDQREVIGGIDPQDLEDDG